MCSSDQLCPAGHVAQWGEDSGKGLAVPEPTTLQSPQGVAGKAGALLQACHLQRLPVGAQGIVGVRVTQAVW